MGHILIVKIEEFSITSSQKLEENIRSILERLFGPSEPNFWRPRASRRLPRGALGLSWTPLGAQNCTQNHSWGAPCALLAALGVSLALPGRFLDALGRSRDTSSPLWAAPGPPLQPSWTPRGHFLRLSGRPRSASWAFCRIFGPPWA